MLVCVLMSVRLSNSKDDRSKKIKLFSKNHHTERKYLCFVNEMNDSSSKNAKIVLSKNVMSKINCLLKIFFHVDSNFEPLSFLKIMLNFWRMKFIVCTYSQIQ